MAAYMLKIEVTTRIAIEPLSTKNNVRIYSNRKERIINLSDEDCKLYLDSIGLKLDQVQFLTKWLLKTKCHGIELGAWDNCKICRIVFGGHFFITSVKGFTYTYSNTDLCIKPYKKIFTWKENNTKTGLAIYYNRFTNDLYP